MQIRRSTSTPAALMTLASILMVGGSTRADLINLSVTAQGFGETDFDNDSVPSEPGMASSAGVSKSAGLPGGVASISLKAEKTPYNQGRGGQISFSGRVQNSVPRNSAGLFNAGNLITQTLVGAKSGSRLVGRFAATQSNIGSPEDGVGVTLNIGGAASFERYVGAGQNDSFSIPLNDTPFVGVNAIMGTFGSFQSSAAFDFAVVLGIDTVPGDTPRNPLIAGRWKKDAEADDPSNPSNPPTGGDNDGDNSGTDASADVTGAYFRAPVTRGSFVYLDPEFAGGYLYQVEGSLFGQFTIPDPLLSGDGLLQIRFGGHTYDYHAGDVFDFTLYDPNGVSAFYLLGLDGSGAPGDGGFHAPLVSGVAFTTPGVAQIWQRPLVTTAVPEPSSLALSALGITGVLGFRRRGRGRRAPG